VSGCTGQTAARIDGYMTWDIAGTIGASGVPNGLFARPWTSRKLLNLISLCSKEKLGRTMGSTPIPSEGKDFLCAFLPERSMRFVKNGLFSS